MQKKADAISGARTGTGISSPEGGASLVAEYRAETDDLYTPASPAPHSKLEWQGRSSSARPSGNRAARQEAGRRGSALKLSIIMAAYNEAETITQAIEEVLGVDYPCEMELIVIDDGSTDATPDLVASIDDPRVVVLRHPANRGKGAAVLTAAATATGTHILPFDADLEYMPEDILRLIQPVLRGRCNVVYGARLFGCNTVYRSYLYAVGNKLFTRTANVMFGAYLSDLHTCLKLIPVDLLRRLDLRETGFGLDTEISASLLRCGIRPFEVPVSYFSRSHEEGKKITWRDAFACLWILVRVRAARRSRFPRASDFGTHADRRTPSGAAPESFDEWQATALVVTEPASELSFGAGG
jgi:dolichol-phosphate hexosyltransferase